MGCKVWNHDDPCLQPTKEVPDQLQSRLTGKDVRLNTKVVHHHGNGNAATTSTMALETLTSWRGLLSVIGLWPDLWRLQELFTRFETVQRPLLGSLILPD